MTVIIRQLSEVAVPVLFWLRNRGPFLLLIIVSLNIAYQFFRLLYLLHFHPLGSVPGPFLARVTTTWQFYYASKLLKAHKIQEAHLKYGDVVRIGPNELSFSNPGLLKSIYGHGVPVVKTEFYTGGNFTGVDNIFSMRNREQHAARRKLMSRNFAQATLMDLSPSLLKKAEKLCHKLEELESKTVNIYPWLHRLGLEFIIMQTIGYDPQLTDTNTHHVALRNLEVFPENFARRSVFPFLTKHGVNFPMKSIREPFRIQAGWVEYCLEVVKEQRKKESKQKSAWIQKLTEKHDEFLGRPMNDLEIAEEIISTLFAGSGTTSATLAFLVYSVTADQTIYNSLKAELREAFPDWPNSSTTLPEIHKIQQLPYLNAVINESLRRYPTIPGSMPRVITSSSLKVGNLELPRNTIVSAQNYSLHMHPEYFPSPYTFDPHRFLGDSSKAKAGLNPFSEGPRACIGRNLAIIELQIVTALFFRYFNVKLDPSTKPEYMEMKVVFSGSPIGEKVFLNLQKDGS